MEGSDERAASSMVAALSGAYLGVSIAGDIGRTMTPHLLMNTPQRGPYGGVWTEIGPFSTE